MPGAKRSTNASKGASAAETRTLVETLRAVAAQSRPIPRSPRS